MAYPFYHDGPVSSYPPRLYAHEPSLSSNNDSEMMGMLREHGMTGGRHSNSDLGHLMGSFYGFGDDTPAPAADDPYPSHISQLPSHRETEDYLRRTIGIPAPRPVNLWALPDTHKATIGEMGRLAIWGSPNKRLTLAQIFYAVEERYPHLRSDDDKPWQRSMRHHLSMKDIFVKIERPGDHPGKGCYWVLDVRKGEGRRGNKKEGEASGATSSEDESIAPAPRTSASPSTPLHTMTYMERPRPDLLPLAHPMAPSGYYQPPRTVDPTMISGNYPMNSSGIMPCIQNPHRRPHNSMPIIARAPMSGNQAESSTRHNVPIPDTRRRTHASSFGMQDDEGRARGLPRGRHGAA